MRTSQSSTLGPVIASKLAKWTKRPRARDQVVAALEAQDR